MFVRLKTLHANQRTYQYVHIVENRWDQGKVRQRLVTSLGRWDQLQASGDLRQVIEGLVAQCPQVKLREEQQEDRLRVESDRLWGPVLIFERLWQELGLEAFLRELARKGRFNFDLERCALALVLQRCSPRPATGEGRSGFRRWRHEVSRRCTCLISIARWGGYGRGRIASSSICMNGVGTYSTRAST